MLILEELIGGQHQTPKQTNLYFRHIIKVTRLYIIYIGDTRSVCSTNFVIKIRGPESLHCALTWFARAWHPDCPKAPSRA